MFDNELKNKIITIDNLFVKEGPISSLCHYLEDGKFTDITADIIFRIILSMQENHVVGTEFALYKVLELLSSYELSSLIQKLTPTDFKDHTRIWIRDLYKYLNSQAIELFQKDSQLVSAITDFVYASFVYHDEEYAKEFKSFFEKTNQVFASFQLCFLADLKSKKIKRREFFTLPAMIADQQCLDWVIDYYLKNTFSDEMMWNFLISLNFVGNYDGRSYFINKINKSTQGKFEPPPNPWEVFNKEKDKLYLKTLLDKELALRFINKAFDVFGKDNIERTEIIKKQFDKEDRMKM